MRDKLLLDYRGKTLDDAERGEVVQVFWPALAWKISAPEPQERVLNIFERAVLAASRVGTIPHEQLADSLSLHKELIRTIKEELKMRGFLDEHGHPTETGCGALLDERNIWEGAATGWVFQNPWTGEMHPHFARQLQFAESDLAPNSGSATSADGAVQSANLLSAPDLQEQPTATMILRALRAHAQREKSRAQIDSDWSREYTASEAIVADRVAFVDQTPWPVLLYTVARKERNGLDPTIDDLFGFGENPQLWDQLRLLAEKEKDPVAKRCVEQAYELCTRDQAPELRDHLEAIKGRGEAAVRLKLGDKIAAFPGVFSHLANMEFYLLLGEEDSLSRASYWNNTLLSGRKAIEAAIKEMANANPSMEHPEEMISEDDGQPKREVFEYARETGFLVKPPRYYVWFRKEDFRRNLKPNQFFNLQFSLIAMLISAARYPEHRLRAIAKLNGDFLGLVFRAKDKGNAGAHDNISGDQRTIESTQMDLLSSVGDFYAIVSLALDLPMTK